MLNKVERTLRALVQKGLESEALKEALPIVVELRNRWNELVDAFGGLEFELPLPVASGGTEATTAAGARTNLGLGTIATQNASAVAITGGSVTGITDLALADGGTGASLADPNADRMMMWDDSAGAVVFFPHDLSMRVGTTDWGVQTATAAEQEAASTNLRPTTPFTQHAHPTSAKFWAKIDGTGVGLNANYNVSSIDDDGTGRIGVNFTTAFSSVDYAAGGIAQRASTAMAGTNSRQVQIRNGTQATTSIDFECFDDADTTMVVKDPAKYYVWGFGDQ